MLKRLIEVVNKEKVCGWVWGVGVCVCVCCITYLALTMIQISHVEEGLQALLFIAEGDMRQALNGLQSTHTGFGHINAENVFKVCDSPHPLVVKKIIKHCSVGNIKKAHSNMVALWNQGYSAVDILGMSIITYTHTPTPHTSHPTPIHTPPTGTLFRVVKNYEMNEYMKLEYIRVIGFTHMQAAGGLNTLLQMVGLVAKLCLLYKEVKA